MKELPPGKATGVVNMIRPDGTQPAPMGFTGGNVINVGRGACRSMAMTTSGSATSGVAALC